MQKTLLMVAGCLLSTIATPNLLLADSAAGGGSNAAPTKFREPQQPLPEIIVPSTGAVFKLVKNKPKLGTAYKAPNGLIWGAILKQNGLALAVNQPSAKDMCKSAGAKLPSKEDWNDLADYLGRGTPEGYLPLFPYFNDSAAWYWTSTEFDNDPELFYAFKAGVGNTVGSLSGDYARLFVRCVVKSGWF